jgi:hypothetical protein
MDMHLNSIIATITDHNKKSYREYDTKLLDNHRKCKIFMPFNTEYQLMIKNTSNNRLLLEIDIDGTNITQNGLIIDKNNTSFIERFVSTNKKFKWVQSHNEKVADPTNPENGIIKIKCYKEKEQTLVNWSSPLHNPINDYPPYNYPPTSPYIGTPEPEVWPHKTRRISFSSSTMGTLKGSKSLCMMKGDSSQNYTAEVNTGATVEGSQSNQHFGSSFWNGNDGSPIYFTFYLSGTNRSPEEEQEYQTFLKLKEKFEA